MSQAITLTRDGVYRSREPMSDEILAKAAPSVFAVEAHESRSDQFTPVPTIEIVRNLRKYAGLEVYGAAQQHARDASRRAFCKHVLRLRRPDQFENDGAPEMLLFNANDGSSSYRLMNGFYRFVCANGLVRGKGYEGARIRHNAPGDVVRQVVEATHQMVSQFDSIADNVESFRALQLTKPAQEAFARSALLLRYEPEELDTAPQTAAALLHTRRSADNDDSLWTVFNRVQENLTRGGQRRLVYFRDKDTGRPRATRKTARPVKGIDGNTKLNSALWTLAEEMAKLAA